MHIKTGGNKQEDQGRNKYCKRIKTTILGGAFKVKYSNGNILHYMSSKIKTKTPARRSIDPVQHLRQRQSLDLSRAKLSSKKPRCPDTSFPSWAKDIFSGSPLCLLHFLFCLLTTAEPIICFLASVKSGPKTAGVILSSWKTAVGQELEKEIGVTYEAVHILILHFTHYYYKFNSLCFVALAF